MEPVFNSEGQEVFRASVQMTDGTSLTFESTDRDEVTDWGFAWTRVFLMQQEARQKEEGSQIS